MAEVGLPVDFAAFPMLPGGREWTAQFQRDLLVATIRLLQRHDRPTAILTGDGEASAVVMACQQLGLRIPQDVTVACFGPHSRDALNAIGQTPAYADLDATRLGTHAASLLLAALRGEPLSSAPMTAPIVPAT